MLAWHKKLSVTVLLASAAISGALAHAAASDSAEALFAKAKAEALQEHKNVLMVFSASWCHPCKLYEGFLEDSQMKPVAEKAFVVQRIDVGEHAGDKKHADTPGGTKLRAELGAVQEPGFPFLVITDAQGKPLVNSYRNGAKDNNIGYPLLPEEIDWYLDMLKRGAPALSQADLDLTREWLQKHARR
jgi:thiol:disulfide interchange protein